MDHKQTVYRTLGELGIAYEAHEHESAYTMAQCRAFDEQIGRTDSDFAHCKNLFLCNRTATHFYLLLIDGDKVFKTADVSKQLGISRLSFAKPADLERFLHCTPGSASPLGLIFDRDHAVTLLVDEDLRTVDELCFHPVVNTESVILKRNDFFDCFLPRTGHNPTFVRIEKQTAPDA